MADAIGVGGFSTVSSDYLLDENGNVLLDENGNPLLPE